MEIISKLSANSNQKKNRTTYGTLALAMFLIVVVSGILLAVPFDVKDPYLSITGFVVSNPWASLIRNLHFWSAQFFLILSLIHLYDHYHYKENTGLKKGISWRLSLGVLIIFLAMLTGFLLKGDADSLQARQILDTLAQRIPLVGNMLAYTLLGDPDSYQLIYVHHIATFTVLITVVMLEHSRRFWPTMGDFLISLSAVLLLSFLFSAPLHDNLNPTVKGPWYFVGFQEILHWLSHPEWSLLIFLVVLILIYEVNAGSGRAVFLCKKSLLIFAGIYFLLTVTGLFFRGEGWKWMNPWDTGYRYSVLHNFKSPRVSFSPGFNLKDAAASPVVMGRKESCLVCHKEPHGFADAHKPEAIGCFSCHGGDPFATSKKQSHRSLILIPGDLAQADQTCGTTQCHPDIVQRLPTGLMATLSGMISVDRYVFNEQNNPDELTNIHDLGNSAADIHLKNLCVRCHLGNPKTTYGPVNEMSRGGGCLACHLNYTEEAEWDLKRNPDTLLNFHPSVSLKITDDHCFGCHSRSGRISTSYQGLHETTLEAGQMPDSSNYRLIEESRVFKKEPEDVHHKLGLECVDCHHSYEVMGDGNLYAHEEDQEDVQCADCHFNTNPMTVTTNNLDNESAKIAALRFGNIENRNFLTTHKYGHVLINAYVENDSVIFLTKNTGRKMLMKPPAPVCTRDKAHDGMTCSACHSAWAPTCIGCHNTYDPNSPGYDMLKNKDVKGSWIEYIGSYSPQEPALGIRTNGTGREIIPVIPGMVLTIDRASFPGSTGDSIIFHRLFAPIAPHTTAAKGRDCKSCHNNPVALGYGRGKLDYSVAKGQGKWTFEPYYQNDIHDRLPADAWTGFLTNRTGRVSTRSNVSPFDIRTQQKILTVGACLTCHDEGSAVMLQSLTDYQKVLNGRSVKCILPDW